MKPGRSFRRLPRMLAISGALTLALLSGCGANSIDLSEYADGTYTGISQRDEDGEYGEVSITIKNGDVIATTYTMKTRSGDPKDANYGTSNGTKASDEYYEKAQAALASAPIYAENLVEVDDPYKVDVISGATLAYDQFLEAVLNALDESQK